jgi:site-specific recombinase XerD
VNRHTFATELLGNGARFEEVADILGNSPEVVRKHYAKWSPDRQSHIDDLMARVHSGKDWTAKETAKHVQ